MIWLGIDPLALPVVTMVIGNESIAKIKVAMSKMPTRMSTIDTAIFNADCFLSEAGTLSGKVLSRLAASLPCSVRWYLPCSSFVTRFQGP